MKSGKIFKVNFLALQLLVVLSLGAFLALPAMGQVGGATVTGTVVDTTGAVIPNTQISIKNVATGVARTVTSNQDGFYTAPNLLPGNYEVTATSKGFSTIVHSGITLTVGGQQVLNITMQVGQLAQQVKVTSAEPAVQLANATINAVVDSNTVRELPLNGRDWTSLATLQPGVLSVASLQPNVSAGEQRAARGFGAQMTISGTRPQQNGYFIDGINVNDYVGSGPGSVLGASLGVDAIQEFSVLTMNYTAEYGRTSGGVINAITRSGTNQFHGDAYEFLRNSALDARNYFDPATIPEFRRNQFGGSVGGPIIKGRTFFFVDYEGVRQNQGTTTVDTVPSLDARNGIIHNSDGTTTNVTVDPAVAPFLGLYGTPNGAILAPGNTALFSFVGSQDSSENFVTARVDHKISNTDSLFGSYQHDGSIITLPDSLNAVLNGDKTKREFVAIGENHIFTPELFNSVRIGFNRNGAQDLSLSAINPLAGNTALAAVPGHNAPALSVPGLTAFAGGVNTGTRVQKTLNAFQGFDDVFLTRGIHSLKFGFSFEYDQVNEESIALSGGSFKFGSLSAFLTNHPKSFSAGFPGSISPRNLRQDIIGGYAQDDIRWKPNLTFNLGLRYEMSTVPTEIRGKFSSFRDLYTDTAPTLGNPLFSNPTLTNFEPRVGFAWDPFRDGKTSVRGAFGLFDFLPLTVDYLSMEANSAPFYLQGSASNLAAGLFPSGAFPLLSAGSHLRTAHVQPNPSRGYVMQWNLNVQRQITPNFSATVAYVGTRGIHLPFHADDANAVLPTLTSAGDLWPQNIGSGTVLNPNVGRVDYLDWESSSVFHGLEVGLIRRISHGFQVQGSYTWSRSIDDGSATTISDPYANSITSLLFFNRRLFRGPSDFNVGQNLVINYLWMIPTPGSLEGPLGWAARGWQVGGVFEASSGLPFTPLIGGDPLGQNNADPFDYPDRVRGAGCGSLVNSGNVNNYIKLNCFTLPTPTTAIAAQCTPFSSAPGTCQNLIGNAGRNEIVGPGLINLDFSLVKNNYIKENLNLQFRAEFFNLLNRSNFASPVANSTLFDQTGAAVGGAGLINETSTANREIQFGLKLVF
ncbi:MAG: TonB-dependent receptor domain-containing protein [Candidatus Acidiferrales bacterium]